jgi:transposase-like protein
VENPLTPQFLHGQHIIITLSGEQARFTTEEKEELRRLRREVKTLRKEKEILRKAWLRPP